MISDYRTSYRLYIYILLGVNENENEKEVCCHLLTSRETSAGATIAVRPFIIASPEKSKFRRVSK